MKKALISRSPHVENILSGKKTWEIRGCNTKTRGEIELIKSGTGTIVGKCEIIDVIGPININELERHIDKHCVPLNRFNDVFGDYKKIYAWVLDNAFKYKSPIKYKNPKGAVVWVKLQ
jgi:hypothetical protein